MELQIKTMLRLHFTPFRMAKINKMTIDASKDMDSFLTNSHSLLAGLQPGAATTDISMENYIKANLKIHLPSEPATPFGIYKEDLISYDRDPCSATLMAFFSQLGNGNNIKIPQLTNGERKRGAFAQWILLSGRERCNLQEHVWKRKRLH